MCAGLRNEYEILTGQTGKIKKGVHNINWPDLRIKKCVQNITLALFC
jgi:hypothetical protein